MRTHGEMASVCKYWFSSIISVTVLYQSSIHQTEQKRSIRWFAVFYSIFSFLFPFPCLGFDGVRYLVNPIQKIVDEMATV